jgi:hypothetical protein
MSEPETPPVPPAEPPAPPPPPAGGGSGPPEGPRGGGSGDFASSNRGLMIVLSYLGPLAVIPFFLAEDEDLRWHARYGLLLFGFELVVWIAFQAFFALVATFDFGCSGCLFVVAYALFLMGLHIACIVQGLNGKSLRVPGVSTLADRL